MLVLLDAFQNVFGVVNKLVDCLSVDLNKRANCFLQLFSGRTWVFDPKKDGKKSPQEVYEEVVGG